jgi:hypothetical protein
MAIQVLLQVQVFLLLVHQVGAEVRLVVSQVHTLVTQVLCGSVVQEIGDYHKLLVVPKEVNIVITKCGRSSVDLQCLVCQDEERTGVQVTLPTLVHVSNV